jgi:RNA polymerase sigma factor (sigma-70 family)
MATELKLPSIERNVNEHEDVKFYPRNSVNKERLLWESFKKGSESAFIAIYKQYFQILYNYGRQISGDTDLIKDCIQEAFITLRKNRKNLASVSSIKAYLLKIIRCKIIKELKKNKRRNELIIHESPLDFQIVPSTEHLIIERQFKDHQLEKINKALNCLSQRQREAIYYYYYNDLSYNEIKDVMGFTSTEAARNLVYRALSTIRKNALLIVSASLFFL